MQNYMYLKVIAVINHFTLNQCFVLIMLLLEMAFVTKPMTILFVNMMVEIVLLEETLQIATAYNALKI